MAKNIPEKYADLLTKPAFANLATVMPDGSPQVTPVWVDFDGSHILFNSALGREKDKNIRRDPRVSVAIQDPGIRTVIWRYAAALWRSHRRALTSTSTSSRKSISASLFIRSGSPAKCVFFIKSNPSMSA